MTTQHKKDFLDAHGIFLPGGGMLFFVEGKRKIEALKQFVKSCESVKKLIDYTIENKIFCCLGINPNADKDEVLEHYWARLCEAELAIDEDLALEASILKSTQMGYEEIVSAAKRLGKTEQEVRNILNNSIWLQYYQV